VKEFAYDVFISYSHTDREFVTKLANKLRENGIMVFLDYEEFRVGSPLIIELERAVTSSRYILLVLSPDFLQSSWNNFESLFIQMVDPTGRERRIIPLIYRDADIPLRLRSLVYIDFRGNFDSAFQALLVGLSKRLSDPPPPQPEEIARPGETPLLEEVISLNRQILSLITASASQPRRQKYNLFGEFGVTEDPDLCFVLMPFGPKWSRPLFDKHILPVCTREGFSALRADDIYGVRGIMQDVWVHINRARLIVADLTTRNPNVFYEVGLAHALGKDVILTTQTMDDVPFDLRAVRCVVYSLELDGPQSFQTDLAKTIKSVVEGNNDDRTNSA
jgi:hypothetical protein